MLDSTPTTKTDIREPFWWSMNAAEDGRQFPWPSGTKCSGGMRRQSGFSSGMDLLSTRSVPGIANSGVSVIYTKALTRDWICPRRSEMLPSEVVEGFPVRSK